MNTIALAALLCCGVGDVSALPRNPQPPAEDLIAGPAAGPWRRLFLDAMVVERQQGLQRVFHAAEKYAANPLIRADRPWETSSAYSGPYLYGTVMWDQGRLRMWYHVHLSGYANCYAESADGLAWTKPELGLIDFRGSRANNLFLFKITDPAEQPAFKGGSVCHNPSVIRQTWEKDPQKRYILFCYSTDYRRPRVAFSPDGLRWKFVAESAQRSLFPSGDVINVGYDPYRKRFVATCKSANRRGRAAAVAVSPDGLHWTRPAEGPVFVADDLDPDATQIYGMPVFAYQGLYVGLPWIYNSRWFKTGTYTDRRMYEAERDSPCTMDTQLAWSWDLVNWTRPPARAQFIPRGLPGQFDSDMIYTSRTPVQVGDRLHFYYGGWDGPHSSPKSKAAIGLAVLRLDGFCSLRAGPAQGWLVSRREVLRRPQVTVNARTAAGGQVTAEILDASEQVLPGFGRAECQAFVGDATSHVLRWKKAEFDPGQTEGDKKIRFYLRNAELFSYTP